MVPVVAGVRNSLEPDAACSIAVARLAQLEVSQCVFRHSSSIGRPSTIQYMASTNSSLPPSRGGRDPAPRLERDTVRVGSRLYQETRAETSCDGAHRPLQYLQRATRRRPRARLGGELAARPA